MIRKVPPPPATKRPGTSVSKPAKPTLPPPPITSFSTNEQTPQEANTAMDDRKMAMESKIQQLAAQQQNLINQVQTPTEPNSLPETEQKIVEKPKVLAMKNVVPQAPKKTVGPPKKPAPKDVEKQQQKVLYKTQQQSNVVTPKSEPQPINAQLQTNIQFESKPLQQTQGADFGQNCELNENTESQKQKVLDKKSDHVENIDKNLAQQQTTSFAEHQKKAIPPPAVKKVGGLKVPPPTKKITLPPKPTIQKTQQTTSLEPISQFNQLNQGQIEEIHFKNPQIQNNVASPELQLSKSVLHEKPQPKVEEKKEGVEISRKTVLPPPIKRAPLPSPKKIQTNPPKLPVNVQTFQVSNQQKQQTTENSPNSYNELQQKLRKLQMMRSRMDESSQESYSNSNQNIEEELEEGSVEDNQERDEEEKQDFINIMDQKDVPAGERNQLKEEFVIGQTNYDEMQIKDYHEENHQAHQYMAFASGPSVQNQLVQPIPINPLSSQLTELSVSQEQDSLRPVPAETIFDSNVSVEQTEHQYLPDEVSNSPFDSRGSIPKHHLTHHQSSVNNVAHADKYHSQANFQSVEELEQHKRQVEQAQDVRVGQKTEIMAKGLDNQVPTKIKHDSLAVNRNQGQAIVQKKPDSKQKPDFHPLTAKLATKKSPQHNTVASINQLLSLFNSRKSQYSENVSKLKSAEEKFQIQERSCQQRISALLEQVNHQNILLLKYANAPCDRMPNHDRLKEVDEL